MAYPYNMVQPWEARERERDLYPFPINAKTQALLRNVGLLKYYEGNTSRKMHSILLAHQIWRWSAQEQGFHVGLGVWYRPSMEDIYFITGLSMIGEVFPQFLDVPHGVAIESQLSYTQRYVRPQVVRPIGFQVLGGKLWISSFTVQQVRCLLLLVTTIAHFSSDGQFISCPLFYYVDSFIHAQRCIKWSVIFWRQFCKDLDRCHVLRHGRTTFPFAIEILCLFFKRFLETRPTFDCHPPRLITEVQMRMWGQMIPKRGLLEYSTRISIEELVLLANEGYHMFVALVFLYVGIDWM